MRFLDYHGRKFLRGPRGTGFLYVSDRMLEGDYFPLYIDGLGAKWSGKDKFDFLQTARRFETWERPYALQIGLGEALRYANDIGIRHIQSYNKTLMTTLRENLSSISGVGLYDKGSMTCNILTFRKDGKSLSEIEKVLESNNVLFSVSQKEWGLIDFEKKGIDWVVRFSPHYFNTNEEMDKVAEVIERI